jgi:hypothetical protein
MELRYIKKGNNYLPQIKEEGGDKWVYFIRNKDESKATMLSIIAQALANCDGRVFGRYSGYHDNPYFYTETREFYFVKEVYVMAFLGAAKSHLTQETIEFKL